MHRLAGSRALLAALWIAGLVIGQATRADDFQPGCVLPFDSIKVTTHPIEHLCPLARGDVPDPPVGANDAAHALQNQAKNNFCATGGPALVTFFSFKKLQQKLDQKAPDAKHWTRTNLPADRSLLSDVYTTSGGDTIGEGSVVRFAAWVMMLRGNSVESCNCETSEKNEDTDIHVVLISSSDRENTEECSSVTAEVSPHFRPETWDAHHLLLANAHPLRFTGQLFYDAAHRPCSGNRPTAAPQTPARVSSWEVHPVYGIDVCKKKSLKNCKASRMWRARGSRLASGRARQLERAHLVQQSDRPPA